MPNGFQYARNPYDMDERVAASAFSKGDVLVLDSNSSLSRVNPYAASFWYAIATADSTQSIRGVCTVMRPKADTEFYLSVQTTLTSHLTAGSRSGVSFDTDNFRYFADSSATTGVVIVKGTDELDQSIASRVLCKIIYDTTFQAIS